MTTPATARSGAPLPGGQPASAWTGSRRRTGDRIFSGTATASGVLILVTLAAVAAFLLYEGYPALIADAEDLPGDKSFFAYVAPLLYGTVLAAVIALLVAFPLSIGIALFISHFAPRKIAAFFGYLVDLLAAVPSVVYGLWGIFFLAPNLVPVYQWLEDVLGFIPFFAGPTSATGRTMLTAGLVLAVMILPIMTAVNREVFLQTPRLLEEASLALGATRWEMIRQTVLPFGKSGIVSGGMLGLGRALGETLAVALVLSPADVITGNLISSVNSNTIAANIALDFPESSGLAVNALIASGLVLFALTFLVNYVARAVIARRREFSGANA
ncbi:phosphate ABC transporter permease subunit PstC [Micromonospora endolithica]|uniref:Phosphate transport system permease protein n=1 Tax=Micromonospora endolithica TaxID=230091 RepID=A0A3A9YSV8_9ACTN|nr:phosphate ABC transporter permease subunit PstC [Micromonospora endolithica]RKN39093.1 phosphate ABC transporter permease subunit PstC [Micromonospora endolithica]TWJ25590.1 phosphate transport system permease protein [Micromonospora endolithica]